MKLRAVEERVDFCISGKHNAIPVKQNGSTERYVRRIKLILPEVVPN